MGEQGLVFVNDLWAIANEGRQVYASTYDYLKKNALYTKHNKYEFDKKVIEKVTALMSTHEHEPEWEPSIYDIAESISSENMDILYYFYNSYGMCDEDIDNIIAVYEHEIGCMMDMDVEQALEDYGLKYRGTPVVKLLPQCNYMDPSSLIYNEGQRVMYKEMIY